MQIQRCKKTARFRERFLVFGGWDRIGHDTCADVKISQGLPADRGTDQNAQLAFAVETQIAESACIRPARDGFEFVNDLHRAEVWRASDAAAGETRGVCI